MRILRIVVTAIFIVVTIVFVGFYVNEKFNKDTTIPVITIEDELLVVNLNADKKEFLKGVTAEDGKDGDLTDKIIVESVSRFIDDGVCKVTYAVCDSNNNVATATRKIQYKDYTSPKFAMKESACYSIYESFNITKVFTASDCIDGDVSRSIIVTSKDYASSVAGVFELEVSVTNSKGDTSIINVPLIVEDRSVSAPEIQLKEYLVYAESGKNIDFSSLIQSSVDKAGNDLKDAVLIEENVNYSKPGTYTVHYYVTDSNGIQGHTVLNVIVG